MAVTIHDVAERAGVSVATVSRVLTGSRPVSPELTRRVVRAAQQLGYRHNALARALRKGCTNTVGMVVPQTSNPFFTSFVESIERMLENAGRVLFLCDSREDLSVERRRVRALLDRRVDALIIAPISSTASRWCLAEAKQEVPVVQLDRYVEDFDGDWVGVDNRRGTMIAVEHVVERGAKRVVFVSDSAESSSGHRRMLGFHDIMKTLGMTPAAPDFLGSFTAEWGRTAAKQIISQGTKPDAVICGNDEIAFGLIDEFKRNGVRVPADVLVTGFDDIRFSAFVDPSLTTVHQPQRHIGEMCVRLLEERIADPNAPIEYFAFKPTLVKRESTSLLA